MTTTREVLLSHLFPSAKDVLLAGLAEQERRRKSDAARDEWFAHNDLYDLAEPIVYAPEGRLTGQAAIEFARAPKLRIWDKASWSSWHTGFTNRMARKDFK